MRVGRLRVDAVERLLLYTVQHSMLPCSQLCLLLGTEARRRYLGYRGEVLRNPGTLGEAQHGQVRLVCVGYERQQRCSSASNGVVDRGGAGQMDCVSESLTGEAERHRANETDSDGQR